ncbi:hypothetical protein [Rubellimicrobium roseum]|uniref:hypothetical protein n=1 Tax=Rubellimicrobium roseum TaxID=687525 RepID=UPI00159BA3DC|nr:hypothetical protein [Rubellimicrobium roseum]
MRLFLFLIALLPSAALAEAAEVPAQTDPTLWYALASVAMLLSFALMHWLVVVRR